MQNNIAIIRNGSNGSVLRKLEGGHTENIQSITISSDCKSIVTRAGQSDIVIWNAGDGSIARRMTGERFIATSPSCDLLVTGGDDQRAAVLWDVKTGMILGNLHGVKPNACCLAISPDYEFIVTGRVDGNAMIWKAQSGDIVLTLEGRSPLWQLARTVNSLLLCVDTNLLL